MPQKNCSIRKGALAWLFAAGVTWLLLPEVRDMVPRQFQKIVMLMLIGVGLLPLILREVPDPPVNNMTAYSDRVEFEFASAEKAMQFSWHNSHAAWIRFNGEELRLPGNCEALMDMLTKASDQGVDEHQ